MLMPSPSSECPNLNPGPQPNSPLDDAFHTDQPPEGTVIHFFGNSDMGQLILIYQLILIVKIAVMESRAFKGVRNDLPLEIKFRYVAVFRTFSL